MAAHQDRPLPSLYWQVLLPLAAVKLLVPLLTHPDFGLHRDEFLYLAMGHRLAWGYLEVPPWIALVGRASSWLGESLFAVRCFPALSGAATLLLTAAIARELGGGRFAQALAAVCYLVSLLYLRINLLFQSVTFDLFFFVLAAYLFVRALLRADRWVWPALGVVVGLGLLNKYTMLLFGFGAVAGLLATPYRRLLREPGPWIAAAVALALWSPNLLWQHAHGWPFVEHMQVLAERQLANVEPLTFLLVQVLMNLYAAPVWILGLGFLLFTEAGRPGRPLAWTYLANLAVLLLLGGKVYYLAPAYPMLLAAGGVAVERYVRRTGRGWIRPAALAFVALGSATLVPVGVPVLSVPYMIRYFELGSAYMGVGEALRWETGKLHELPQDYADMLGWEEQVAAVAGAYHGLPPEDRARAAVWASNYGEAGAVDFYGDRYGLPGAISQNGSYWLWGPGTFDGEVLVTVGIGRESAARFYGRVDRGASYHVPHARERDVPILILREPRQTVDALWEQLRAYRY